MKKINEDKTREGLMRFAKLIGAEEDLKFLLSKWDNLLAQVDDSPEKIAMSRQAILDVQKLLDIHAEKYDGLTINNEVIVAGKKS